MMLLNLSSIIVVYNWYIILLFSYNICRIDAHDYSYFVPRGESKQGYRPKEYCYTVNENVTCRKYFISAAMAIDGKGYKLSDKRIDDYKRHYICNNIGVYKMLENITSACAVNLSYCNLFLTCGCIERNARIYAQHHHKQADECHKVT